MISNQTKFNINQNRANTLFENTPVWKSLLIVAFPGIMVALLSGLFVFVNQLMLVDLIPIDHLHTNQWLWGNDYSYIIMQIKQHNLIDKNQIWPIYDIQDVIKSANSFSTPLIMIVTATVLLSSQGAAVIYSKALGNKSYKEAQNVYYEALIVSTIFCLVMSILLWAVGKEWIQSEAQLPKNYNYITNSDIRLYYQKFSDLTISWASHFFDVFLVSAFLQSYALICTYFLNSEGRNSMPMFIVLFSSFLGLIFSFFCIYFGKMQMYGAAISTIFTYLLAVIFFIIYINHLKKQKLTCLVLNKQANWSWKEVWNIIYLGLGNFFKNMSIAFVTSFSLQILNSVNETINGSAHALFYSSVEGVVLPIYNLMYLSMIGIVRSARSVTSYVYGVHDFKKVRLTYWYTFLYTTIYSTILFFIVVFLLSGYCMPSFWNHQAPFLLMFNIHYENNIAQYNAIQFLLMIYMLQLPFFGFLNAGELFFQATEKPFWSIIVSLTLGVFVLFPVLFLMRYISLLPQVHSVLPSLCVPALDGIISSGVVGLISLIYMYHTFNKEETRTLLEDQKLKSLQKQTKVIYIQKSK